MKSVSWIVVVGGLGSGLLLGGSGLAAEPDGYAFLKFPAGQVLVYEGTARMVQRNGEDVQLDSTFEASVLLHVLPETAVGAGKQVLVVRSLAGSDGESYAAAQRFLLQDREPRLVPKLIPQEVDEQERNLDIHFPMTLVSGGAAKVKALGQVPVGGEYRHTRETKETRVTDVLELTTPEAFEFNYPGKLNSFREEHVYDTSRGLLERMANKSSLVLTTPNAAIRVDLESSVSLVRSGPLEGADKYVFETSLEDLLAIEERLAQRDAGPEVKARAEKLVNRSRESSFRALGSAATGHVSGFETAFLKDPKKGKILAQRLGKAPPDFELFDLEGKKVRLSEAIRGRVVYLNFWGVG
jgi:hypothetical protein